ncbi:CaiB/BaiF CoA transferase family protein [Nocardioides sp.]|uniref:CaiB/BaiF CoA transferase family protein n=1 Tax=Nocardioides sp. TaxID=35761 RepID=UPI00352966F7
MTSSSVATPGGGPLAGLTVVELAGIGPGPFAATLLGELGARVVRVERPAGAEAGLMPVAGLRRSRANVAVDLKHPRGREVVLRLVDGADVLIEGMRPGAAERLGIGPDDCLARNPRLVYGRITGWGQDGPLAHTAGHDINYAALSGALHATGEAGKPRQAVNLVADFGGGTLYLVMGVLAALLERERSGRGQVVDAAMVDGAASLMTMVYSLHAAGLWQDRREANLLDGAAPFYDTYACADGGFVAVGALEPQFYAALLGGLGLDLPEGQYAVDAWPRHRAAIAERFASRDRDEWLGVFDGTDACVTPVLSLADAPRHPHLAARGVFADVPGGVEPRVAPRFSRTPGREPTAPRATGADTAAVLGDLGFSADEVAELLDVGAVVQTHEP